MFTKLYDGTRHDSGDPYKFTDKFISHYEKMGVDPQSKAIIFSNSLNTEKAIAIKNYCRGKIKCSVGIGTFFTNDVGVTPLNMVIKMTSAKPEGDIWTDTIKISDDEGKHTGNEKEIEVAKYTLKIK
jgi:nicotinate phosphoribosyltransferase